MYYIEDIGINMDGTVYGIRDTFDRVKEYYNLEQLNQLVKLGIPIYGLSLTKRGKVSIKDSFILSNSYLIAEIKRFLNERDCINTYIYNISDKAVSIRVIKKYEDSTYTFSKIDAEILSVFTDSIRGVVRDNGTVSFYNYYESEILNNLDSYLLLRKNYLSLDYDLFVSNLKYVIDNLKTEFYRSYYSDMSSDDLRKHNWSKLFRLVSLRKPFVFLIKTDYSIKEVCILGLDKVGYYTACLSMENYIKFFGQDFRSGYYSDACAGNHFKGSDYEYPILMEVIKKSKK